MPVQFQCTFSPLSASDVTHLWQTTLLHQEAPDQEVGIRCLPEEEIAQINQTYRQAPHPTNVLTFSYGEKQHDIALCLPVIKKEAAARSLDVRDYFALVLVHGFLHALGLDHERSAKEAEETSRCEQEILLQAGFSAVSLTESL